MSSQNHIIKPLAVTAVFNTAIALVLRFMVIRDSRFLDIWVISQLTGLSICLCVRQAVIISENVLKKWLIPGIAAGLITGVAAGGVLSGCYLYFLDEFSMEYTRVFYQIAVFGLVFGVPITYFFMARERLAASEQQIREEKIRRLKMEKEAAMTSLRLLQAQIEPHFLFNTLSNILSLMDTDVDRARQMLMDLNEYLRISLDRTRQEMVTLSRELDLVRRYLNIFKIRMGSRLHFEITDLTGMPDLPFPPLVVQPLVENALKYGLEPKVDGGKITIDCRLAGRDLVISVSDTGMGLDDTGARAGVGLNNVSRR
ncbi:MAG: histidine kinase, partial [Desulfobacteraceae bacterium]|nr:histidine kinase [Desulfobacteraceae bacterium]